MVPQDSNEPGQGAITADAEVNGKLGRIKVRATGTYAAAVVSLAALLGVLFVGDPLNVPKHALAAIVLAFVSGALIDSVLQAGRLGDALREKENYRLEVNRMAVAKSKLEEEFIRSRLSSGGGTPSMPPSPTSHKKKGRA